MFTKSCSLAAESLARKGLQKIDFTLASEDIFPSITAAGILPFHEGFCSDHRTSMNIDLNIVSFIHGTSDDPANNTQRLFTSKNYKRTRDVKAVITSEWHKQLLTSRIATLSTVSKLPEEQLRKQRLLERWEKLDAEVGNVFKLAITSLRNTKTWTPQIAEASGTKRYWRYQVFQPGICWNRDKPLKSSNAHFWQRHLECLCSSTSSRSSHTFSRSPTPTNSASLRQSPGNTDWKPTVKQDTGGGGGTEIHTFTPMGREAKGSVQRKNQALKPITSGSISKVDVPTELVADLQNMKVQEDGPLLAEQHPHMVKVFCHLIQQKRKGHKEWTTLLDKCLIETAILLYNQQHFRQAATTPFGQGFLAKLLGHAGITEQCYQILDGIKVDIPPELEFPKLS